jgi:hypothetical protein
MPIFNPPSSSSNGTGGSAPVHHLGEISGEITLDFANGGRQYCALNGNTLFGAPTGGTDLDELVIGISYVTGNHTLEFSGIKMPAEAAALMPVTLEQWRCYLITLRHLGGGWTLIDITPANTESQD